MPPHSLLLSTRSKSQIIDVQGGNIDYFLKYLPQKLSEDKDFQQSKTLSNIYVITNNSCQISSFSLLQELSGIVFCKSKRKVDQTINEC
jgi:hypothetical protein